MELNRPVMKFIRHSSRAKDLPAVDGRHERESKTSGVIQFRFSESGKDIGGLDMKVLELRPDKRVLWEVVEGP